MIAEYSANLPNACPNPIIQEFALQGQDSVSSEVPHRALAFFNMAFSTYRSPIVAFNSLISCSVCARAPVVRVFRLCSPPFRKTSTHPCTSLGVRSFCRAMSMTVVVCLKIWRIISALRFAVHRCCSAIFPLLVHYTWSEREGGHYTTPLRGLSNYGKSISYFFCDLTKKQFGRGRRPNSLFAVIYSIWRVGNSFPNVHGCTFGTGYNSFFTNLAPLFKALYVTSKILVTSSLIGLKKYFLFINTRHSSLGSSNLKT